MLLYYAHSPPFLSICYQRVIIPFKATHTIKRFPPPMNINHLRPYHLQSNLRVMLVSPLREAN